MLHSTVPAELAIQVRQLRKRFDARDVLIDLDWSIPTGRVVGLLGRNGAGKTTLLRCLTGISPIDAGHIEVLGQSMDEPGGQRLQRMGFVPQTFDLFPWMRVRGYLDFTAAFYPHWDCALCERLLDEWQIDRKQKIGQLSQGQRQKLAIIRAMAPDPDLLLLDEPVASLDPQARHAFMNELLELVKRPGKTVIFSTHITADLERASADIALLKNGRIVLESPLPELRRRIRQVTLTRAEGWPSTPHEAGILSASVDGAQARLVIDSPDDAALTALAEREGAQLDIVPMSLEDLFVELA